MPRIETEIKLDFKDVLIRPKRSTLTSRKEVSLERKYKFKNSNIEWNGVPIIASNMDSTGTFEMSNVLSTHKIITCIHKHYSLNEWTQYLTNCNDDMLEYICISTGILDNDLNKLDDILKIDDRLKMICIDVANGYSEKFVEVVKKLRNKYKSKVIIAGNVVTGEMVEELILAGANIIKVGIGPGSVCTTRKQTGVGYPQLSAIIECADAAHGLGGHIIADGGCTCPGDIAKAFGGGSDFVMMGGMLAGHYESGGKLVEINGDKFKMFYGMSSDTAMKKYKGGVAEYRSSEGKTVNVKYKGCVNNTILDVLGGLRSACTYVGAKQLKELSRRTTFIRVSQQLNNIYSK